MTIKNNVKCICCGKEYKYCNRCGEDMNKPAWMAIYHDENCKNIFMIATDFESGILTKEQAVEKLSKCDLSNRITFREDVQKSLDKILGKIDTEIKETKIDMNENKEDKTYIKNIGFKKTNKK